MKNSSKRFWKIVLGLFVVGVGAAIAVPPFFWNVSDVFRYVCLALGILAAVFGIVLVVRAAAMGKAEEAEVTADLNTLSVSNGTVVSYIPQQSAESYVNAGARQSLEEKFDQILKMDKTQFVIYVARLFSHKGYGVTLTPVTDNHGVDFLAEKFGVTIAVGCLKLDKLVAADNLHALSEGRAFYGTANALALTNTYFDRTAVDFAREQKMSLVDRSVLAEDFM